MIVSHLGIYLKGSNEIWNHCFNCEVRAEHGIKFQLFLQLP